MSIDQAAFDCFKEVWDWAKAAGVYNHLLWGYADGDHRTPGGIHPCLGIHKREKYRLWGFIPGNKDTMIFCIHTGVYGAASGKKELKGGIFDKENASKIREVLEEYRGLCKHGITGLDFIEDFTQQ